MAGLPGSGKSAVAEQIARALSCALLSVDPIEAARRNGESWPRVRVDSVAPLKEVVAEVLKQLERVSRRPDRPPAE